MGLPRVAALLVVLALLVAACTDEPVPPSPDALPDDQEAPAPPAGLRVGLVLPAGDPSEDRELAYLRTDLRGLAATLPDGVADLQLLFADDERFVPDLAGLLAQRGTDLVCVLGGQGRRVVSDLFDVYPRLRYCALPASSSNPQDRVTLIDVRFDEIGHAVGVAAIAAVGEDASVGAVIGANRVGRDRLLDGLRAAVGEDHLVEYGPEDAETALEAVQALLDADVDVAVIDVGHGAAEALALAADELTIINPISTLTGGPVADATLVSWRVRWDVILRPTLARLVDPDVDVPRSVGLAEEAVRLTPGSAAGLRVRSALDAVIDELRRGVRDPLEPLVRDDEDEEDEDETEDDEDADPSDDPDATGSP